MSKPKRALLDSDEPTFVVANAGPRRALDSSEASGEAFVPRRAALAEVEALTHRSRSGWWQRAVAPIVAIGAVSAVVGFGVAIPEPSAPASTPTSEGAVVSDALGVSRAGARAAAEAVATSGNAQQTYVDFLENVASTVEPVDPLTILGADAGVRYVKSSGVNVRKSPTTDSDVVKKLDLGAKVKITKTVEGEWQQLNLDGKVAWISKEFLQKDKPAESADGNYSTAACKYGSSIESGVTANTKRVFRAFCAVFPQITSWGGRRAAESWSYHTRGAALDAMVSDSELGWRMAKWAAANAKALNIDQIFYAQHVWTKERPTWRTVSDQGNATANHYDHVHISVGG